MAPTPEIAILYKGKLAGVCTLILYTVGGRRTIFYELQENPLQFSNPVGLKLLIETGTIDLFDTAKDNIQEAVDEVIDSLFERYAFLTRELYAEEITHGLH